MKTTVIVIILIGILLIISFFIFQGDDLEIPLINKDSSNAEDNQNSNKDSSIQIKDEDILNSPELNSGSGSGGSGSGSSSSSSSSQQSSCQQISYALKNFIKDSECLSYSGEVCVSKKVTCSVEIYNLDEIVSGAFGMKISITKGASIINEYSFSENIDSKEFVKFEKTLEFQSLAEEGDANQEYSCLFEALNIPEKC